MDEGREAMDVTKEMRAARPYLVRAALAGAVALAGMITASSFGDICFHPKREGCSGALLGDRGLALAGGLVMLVAGVVAVRGVARAIRAATEDGLGTARSSSLAFFASLIGYGLLILATLSALDVDLGGLLVGGAITGVILGIAAQQTLGNFFAGIVLLLARPFAVGQHVVLRSGPLGGEYEGTVTDMGVFYVNISTERGPVALPNAGVLTAAVGPGARAGGNEPVDDD